MTYTVQIHWAENDSYSGTSFESLEEAKVYYDKAVEYAETFFQINTIRLQVMHETHWNNETLEFWRF